MSKKINKAVVLYLPDDGGKKRCGRCMMFLEDISRCSIHGNYIEIEPSMVCGLYLPGGPSSSKEHTMMEVVTPRISGLINTTDDGTHCQSCVHSRNDSTSCEYISGEIEPDGCCNFWENEKIEESYLTQI